MSDYSVFFEVINLMKKFEPSIEHVLNKNSEILKTSLDANSDYPDKKCMKLKFIIRQLQLVSSKNYTTSDFRCTYEN